MVALAKTDNFMLGAASVQIGPEADLFDLTSANSIGLTKNFTLTGDPTYTELTAGVKNVVVDSALTNNSIGASMEVYEASAENIKWGLGLDATQGIADLSTKEWDLGANVAEDDTTFDITGVDVTTDFAADDWAVITEAETFHVAKVASSAFSTDTTVTITGYPFPAAFTTAAKIKRVNAITAGGSEDQPYLSAKVEGVLSNGDSVFMLFPKLRIVRGFTLSFTSDNHGNMPFEFTPQQMTATDPHWGLTPSNDGVAFIFKKE